MQAQTIVPSNFPLLSAIYVKPSLIEASVPVGELSDVLVASDPGQLVGLSTRKAAKLAKQWAPLIVHNMLADAEAFSTMDSAAILARLEEILNKASGSEWASAFRRAGEKGVPPSGYIRALPVGSKQVLHAERSKWKAIADQIEKEITGWILAHRAEIGRYFASQEQGEGYTVSLKKLAKFKLVG